MLKKFLSLTLAGAVALSAIPVFAENAADKFTDISNTSPYYDAIEYTCDTGIFCGTSDTEFSPEVQLTRGMFVTLLGRTYVNLYGDVGAPEEPVAETGFMDVFPDDYYGPSVCWAWQNGIVSGYSDELFAPNDILTKEQAVTILYRFAEYAKEDIHAGEDTNILSFEDYDDISKYAIPAIQWGIGFDVIKGEGPFIEPQHKVTRAETAELLYNYVTSSLNRRGDREVTEE